VGAPSEEIPDDGVDQDCDGADLTDLDGDGHPWPEDCDDQDPRVHPDAVETWYDDVDDDCDGNLDDADGDGFPPTSLGGLDCDDSDGFVHPYAFEVCGDGLDNDCDGTPGHCAFSDMDQGDADGVRWGEQVYDHAAFVVPLGDHDSDGFDDVLIGADQADRPGAYDEGAVYVVYGPIDRHTQLGPEARIRGDREGGRIGTIIAGDGDVNGDGFTDVLLGAPHLSNPGPTGSGVVCLVAGPVDLDVDMEDWACLYGDTEDMDLGTAVLFGPDSNDDGLEDLALAAPGGVDPSTGEATGLVVLVPGPFEAGWDSAMDHRLLAGPAPDAGFGTTLLRLDLDADGVDELLVGAPDTSGQDGQEGAVLVYKADDPEPVHILRGGTQGLHLGDSLAGGGDVDDDGSPDLVVATRGDRGSGANSMAWLFLGGQPLGEEDWTRLDAEATWTGSDDRGPVTITGVASGGDMTGDGFGDVVFAASSYDHDVNGDGRVPSYEEDTEEHEQGAAFIVLGPVSGSQDLSQAPCIVGDRADEQLAESVAMVGDLDGDGLVDLGLGTTGYDGGQGPRPENGNDPHYGGVFFYLGRAW